MSRGLEARPPAASVGATLRRAVAPLTLLAALAGLAVVGASPPPPVAPAFTVLGAPTMPFVPAGSFITSSWFCPGVQLAGGGQGGVVVVANPSDVAIAGRITAYSDLAGSPAVTDPFEVAARSTTTVDLAAMQPGGTFASALVEIEDGGGFVEQRADHPAGNAVAPCANATSSNWYFADGFTLDGSTEALVITNPYPDDAILDFEFATNQGTRRPASLQGYPVRGRSISVVTQALLPRDEAILAVKVTAKRGRVVAARAQQYLGGGRLGYTMNLGAPALADQYYFADGEVGPGIIERFSVYNGSDREVTVQAVFLGVPLSDAFANDTELTIPAGEVGTLIAGNIEGLPVGRHGVVFSTLDGGAIVVERAITRPAGDFVATTVVLGAPSFFAATRWSMAIGTDMAVENVLVVLNVDGVEGTLTVKALGPGGEVPVPGMEALAVPAGGVLAVDISDPVALGRPLVVESTTRVFVERLLPRGATLRGRSGSFALAG